MTPMGRHGWIRIIGAVVGALVLAACGGPSTPHPSPGSAGRSTSTTASGPTSTTTGTAGWTSAVLPIERCPTSFAVTPSPTTAPLPTTATVNVPVDEAANLVVYTDDAGIMMLIGPTDWACRGLYGADGSGGLVVSPMGEAVPSDPDAGWHLAASSADEAIVGYETGGSTVQGADLACPLFAAAATATRQDLGRGCAVALPAGETHDALTSSAVAFEDPAGVAGDGMPSGGSNPANGVMVYAPPKPAADSAYVVTCTLPAARHQLCTAVLDHFESPYG